MVKVKTLILHLTKIINHWFNQLHNSLTVHGPTDRDHLSLSRDVCGSVGQPEARLQGVESGLQLGFLLQLGRLVGPAVFPELLQFALSAWQCIICGPVFQPWSGTPDPFQELWDNGKIKRRHVCVFFTFYDKLHNKPITNKSQLFINLIFYLTKVSYFENNTLCHTYIRHFKTWVNAHITGHSLILLHQSLILLVDFQHLADAVGSSLSL